MSNGVNLNSEDTNKILNEINQIINQRFQLTISAITVFGVFIAWTIPKDLAPGKQTINFLFAAPILLLIFLFFLFFYSLSLNHMISTLSTYLRVTQRSKWENDFVTFRGKQNVGYSFVEYVIFFFLGVITLLFPFALYWVSKLNYPPSSGIKYTLICTGVLYSVIVAGVMFLNWGNNEKKATDKWTKLKNEGKI